LHRASTRAKGLVQLLRPTPIGAGLILADGLAWLLAVGVAWPTIHGSNFLLLAPDANLHFLPLPGTQTLLQAAPRRVGDLFEPVCLMGNANAHASGAIVADRASRPEWLRAPAREARAVICDCTDVSTGSPGASLVLSPRPEGMGLGIGIPGR
jgi:hypothetical protein